MTYCGVCRSSSSSPPALSGRSLGSQFQIVSVAPSSDFVPWLPRPRERLAEIARVLRHIIARGVPGTLEGAKYFSIPDLAHRWCCSRGTVYNTIRGERVLDFAAPGRRGKKLVPAEVVHRIEQRLMKVFR
jgi:hypothetical protein